MGVESAVMDVLENLDTTFLEASSLFNFEILSSAWVLGIGDITL